MIKNIVKDEEFLKVPSEDATSEDAQVAQDLLDTLEKHSETCVGLAANMIGVQKRIIVFTSSTGPRVMFNPSIVSFAGKYKATEGCLSLQGARSTNRYKRIKVKFQDEQMKEHVESFKGYPAQIIQHEIDHCNGIII